MLLSPAATFHHGEQHMHKLMHVPSGGGTSPTSPFLTPNGAFLLQRAPLLAIGTLDPEGRPWTTLLGSDQQLAQVMGENIVGIKACVDSRFDPVVEALMRGKDSTGTIRLEDGSEGSQRSREEIRRIGGLTIDLETRKRVKLAGRMMIGNVAEGPSGSAVELTLIVKIEESLGNCPKYLNKKHIVRATPEAELISDSSQLCPEAVLLLEKADLFFVTSSHEKRMMDTNHRGGPRGFTRLLSNDASGAVLVWPEYSGNRLYQTLGNFITTPVAGLTVPDFETGDMLYMTGIPEVITGAEAAAVLPRSNLAVKLKITAARFVKNGLAFRGESGDPSPYNPGVRYTVTEKVMPGTAATVSKNNQAILVSKTDLTPTISRFRFRIEDPAASGPWKPGQYATLSFADELDVGYSHMRDDDPRSLNDDFIRTFTVSNSPSKRSLEEGVPDEEFELTIRKVGNATGHLFRQNPRAGFEVPLKGFEGEFKFEAKTDGGLIPVITSGIGITPVLGQLDSINISSLRLLWSAGIADIGLVADTLQRHSSLIKVTKLYLTGNEASLNQEQQKTSLKQVEETGIEILRRRIDKSDVDEVDAQPGVDEWYMCVGPGLKTSILSWLKGKRVVYEDFDY